MTECSRNSHFIDGLIEFCKLWSIPERPRVCYYKSHDSFDIVSATNYFQEMDFKEGDFIYVKFKGEIKCFEFYMNSKNELCTKDGNNECR